MPGTSLPRLPCADRSIVEPLIYRLLGLPLDTDVEHLRAAYEGAVAAATARADWTRAGELSAAFDALPRQMRLAVYSGRDRNAPRWQPTPPAAKTPARGRARGRAQCRPRSRRRLLPRIVLAGFSVILSFGALATWLTRHPASDQAVIAPPRTPAPAAALRTEGLPPIRPAQGRTTHTAARPTRAAAPTWSPMRALYPGSGEVLVPHNAITDARGLAEVMCPDDFAGSSWRIVKALPGQHFTCPSGYVGLVRVPNAR
jgi:hypothetical protein